MSQFAINFIHVTNFSDIHKVLRISVLHKDLCIGGVDAGKNLA